MPEEMSIPTNLPSDCGMDYIPLATMLATGQLAEADQVSVCCVYTNLAVLLYPRRVTMYASMLWVRGMLALRLQHFITR